MLFLLIVFFLTFAALTALLWVGTVFIQEYWYTEPSSGVGWQAPAAAGVIAVFFTVWCAMIWGSDDARPDRLPYDTLFRFSPKIDMFEQRAEKLWAVEKGSKELIPYEWRRISRQYERPGRGGFRPYHVEAIIVKKDNKAFRFTPVPGEDDARKTYRNPEGWTMIVRTESGPTGMPYYFDWGRFLFNLFLNFIHFVLWIVAFWLILRFDFWHSFGLAIAMWLVTTLILLPLMLTQAAEVGRTAA